jgi:hypothetical protein
MGWTGWFKDDTGGDSNEKITTDSGYTKTEILRTEDNAKVGSRNDHSHVIIREKPDGSKTASGHGIFGGKRK